MLLHPYRYAAIAWLALTGYLLLLNTAAGVWYYNQLPPRQVAVNPPAKPPAIKPSEQTGQPGESSDSPSAKGAGGTNGLSRPGSSRPPMVVQPPTPVEVPHSPGEGAAPTGGPPSLLVGAEPPPARLRRRLLVLVLVSTDLVNMTQAEEEEIPLRANLQGVLENFRGDLAGERIYVAGREDSVASWDLAAAPGELVAPFELDAYDAAIAAAGPAINRIVAAESQSQYDVLLVWYSHFRPDDAPKAVALPAELASAYCLWAGSASHEDSAVLANLFPGRRWLLRQGDAAATTTGLIVGQLRIPAGGFQP